jgi:hypothetical protein
MPKVPFGIEIIKVEKLDAFVALKLLELWETWQRRTLRTSNLNSPTPHPFSSRPFLYSRMLGVPLVLEFLRMRQLTLIRDVNSLCRL